MPNKNLHKNFRNHAEVGVNIEANPLIIDDSDNSAQESNGNKHGWSFAQLNVLVASGMAGGGILMLPSALAGTGWLGVPIMIVICIMAAFSCQRIADCWAIIEERTPEIKNRQRTYAIIVREALGITWSVILSAANIFSTLCGGVIYLLLAAQIIETELVTLLPDTGYCMWYLILVACNLPFLFFKRLRDYPLTGLVAFGATVLACLFYFIQMMIDAKPFTVFRLGIHGFKDFFLAFGTMMFAFGGAPTFPTVQNNMADRPASYKNMKYYFIGTLFIYLSIAITGYMVYGEFVASNLALSIKPTPLTSIANVAMFVHLLTAFGFLLNSSMKEFEELFNVPQDSVMSRLLSRASVMVAVLFVGESIPRFDTVIALIGGTTVALLTFVLPSYCYMELIAQNKNQGRDNFERPGWMKFACWQIIIIGLVGGLGTTFSALSAMSSTSLARPCYYIY